MDDLSVDLLVRATEGHSNAKTLTAPKITVINGEMGMINVTSETSFVESINFESAQATVSGVDSPVRTLARFEPEIGTTETGIVMMVAPTLTADKKYVILSINTELSDVNFGGLTATTWGEINGTQVSQSFPLPKTQNTTIQTRVTVPDMGTVLLGGLTLTAERQVDFGVPVLSKIPFLQRLVSNRSDVRDKQILLILVRPTIILRSESEEDAMAQLN